VRGWELPVLPPTNCISNFEKANLLSLSIGSQTDSVRFEMITSKTIVRDRFTIVVKFCRGRGARALTASRV